MGKKKINLEVEKTFQSEVHVGNAFAAYVVRNTAKEAKENGGQVYFKPLVTKTGILLECVGLTASIPFDIGRHGEEIDDFIQSVKGGKQTRVDIETEEMPEEPDGIGLNFIVYKGVETSIAPKVNQYNPFKDKNSIPVKRMTITEEQYNRNFLKEDLDYAKDRKRVGDECIYKVDIGNDGLELISLTDNHRTNLRIHSEKVGWYIHCAYDVYARIKEIDDSYLQDGFARIKYDIIVLEQ